MFLSVMQLHDQKMVSCAFLQNFKYSRGQFLYSVQRTQTTEHLETAVLPKETGI